MLLYLPNPLSLNYFITFIQDLHQINPCRQVCHVVMLAFLTFKALNFAPDGVENYHSANDFIVIDTEKVNHRVWKNRQFNFFAVLLGGSVAVQTTWTGFVAFLCEHRKTYKNNADEE